MTATESKEPRTYTFGVALTAVQNRVLTALRTDGLPLSAYALRDRLGDRPRLAPVQVYRALDRLMTLGLVHRLESLNAYVACNRRHAHGGGPLAFAICRGCGHVDELEAPGVRKALRSAAGSRSFKVEAAMLELTGLCQACQEFDSVEGAPS